MRVVVSALSLALLAGPVLAQTAPTTPVTAAPITAPAATTAPAAAGPAATTQAAPAKPAVKPKRPTFDQRFDTANISHDGKLTLAQAKTAKMRAVTKNFAAIDKDSKGFITKDDVVAYRKTPRGKNQTL